MDAPSQVRHETMRIAGEKVDTGDRIEVFGNVIFFDIDH